jgi:tRNA 2-thiouridine synthesizing protein A
MTENLDARGLLCPLPVLKARKRLKTMSAGDLLQVHADDPAAWIDVPHYCIESGNTLLQATEDPDGSAFYLIKKA